MNRIVKGVLWAIPPILFLVVVPRYLYGLLPASVTNDINSYTSFKVATFVIGLTVFGLVLAALSFLQTWAYKWSIVKPVASSLHIITSYSLLLFLLGFGNPLGLGTGTVSINLSSLGSTSGNLNLTGTLSVQLVSTLIVLLVGIAVAMKIVQRWMEFPEDKQFHEMDTQAAQAAQTAPPQATPTPTCRFCGSCASR